MILFLYLFVFDILFNHLTLKFSQVPYQLCQFLFFWHFWLDPNTFNYIHL